MRISDWSSDVCSSDLGAVRPVELIEVDMVRLQPLQARLDRRLDVLAVEARLAATDIGEALSVGADDLGGDDNLAAGAARGHPVSDDLLGAPIKIGRAHV